MYAFLGVLAFAMNIIATLAILDNLDSFSIARLLQTMACYHVQLADLVLRTNKRFDTQLISIALLGRFDIN